MKEMEVSLANKATEENAQQGTDHVADEPPKQDYVDHAKDALGRINADFFVYSGEITFSSDKDVCRLLGQKASKAKKAVLWLTTPGGLPDSAYGIARAFQRHYEEFAIFITGWCKSSGTLICLGASELVMSDTAQLGPLDIQLLNKEEIGERHSGLNPLEAIDGLSQQAIEVLRTNFYQLRFNGGLSTKQALEVATNLTSSLFSPITAQLDLLKYGEFTRAMRIAFEYGLRLVKKYNGDNVHKDAINLLVSGYPSHSFCIDRSEAEERLFAKVSPPHEDMCIVAQCFQGVIDKHLQPTENPLLLDLKEALGLTEAEQSPPRQGTKTARKASKRGTAEEPNEGQNGN